MVPGVPRGCPMRSGRSRPGCGPSAAPCRARGDMAGEGNVAQALRLRPPARPMGEARPGRPESRRQGAEGEAAAARLNEGEHRAAMVLNLDQRLSAGAVRNSSLNREARGTHRNFIWLDAPRP
jgi:hypothetical protein